MKIWKSRKTPKCENLENNKMWLQNIKTTKCGQRKRKPQNH